MKSEEQILEQLEGEVQIQLVVFKLGNEEYGVDISEVERIIKMTEVTRIPHAPGFVEGIINLRGKIVVIVNLLKRFGTFNEEEHIGSHIIVSEVEGSSFGIIVDDVEEVLKINKKDTRKAPGIIASKIHAEYLKGIGILDEGKRLLILIDLKKILAEKEMVEMAEVTQTIKKQAEVKEEAARKAEEAKKPKITEEEIAQRFNEHFGTAQKEEKAAEKSKTEQKLEAELKQKFEKKSKL